MNKISRQEEMIRNLKSDLVQSQKGYDELRESMHKKMSSIEMIIQNQLKIGAEDSFANYINLNDDMNYSLIKKNKGARAAGVTEDKDESGIYEYNVLEGLMNMDRRLTQTMEKNSQKNLPPVKEIRESRERANPAPAKVEPKPVDMDPNATQNIKEVTGNSFFNDVSLGLKKTQAKQPVSLGQKQTIITKPGQGVQLKGIPEEKGPEHPTKGFNVYQMENAKANPEMAAHNESMLGTKIKRENVTRDLNCTINDESILEYVIDENGYLMTDKGNLIYDDDGKVVKLTDEQIEKFKDSEAYEEVEY